MPSIPSGGQALINVDNLLKKARIGDKMRVADLGCGSSGHFLWGCAHAVGRNGKVYAVDVQKKIIESVGKQAKTNNLPQVEAVWSNLEVYNATKIETASLDAAFLVNTLYQSEQRGEILREAIRLLKPEGKLIVVDWKHEAAPFGPSPQERVNQDQLVIACERLGMRQDEEGEAGKYHFSLTFSKNIHK
jgi:ubiquinone/menaquinone biosynthesis C-methylase UbiE